ncbi:PREDICTED: protein transport protein Sec24A-like [Thamnophis sirtalis]|uniref:Protein transport protein Sec24A-like n=1 Tax=Thamnophis sirtalis TaxID=35019 RepID=A0A6I9YYU7_9SAUR|nr:PREDICTED: protein transport protein Sec24A-like [Thamnophis sirtalis]
MAQPGRPAYNSLTRAGQPPPPQQPYSNGPVPGSLMNSSHLSDGQGHNSLIPNMYTQQIATKNPLHATSGQYSHGTSWNIPSGQTLNRTPMGSSLTASQPSPVAQMPSLLQNSTAISTSDGSFYSGSNFSANSNRQYMQNPLTQPNIVSQPNHFAHTVTSPLLPSGNTNLPTNYHYVSSAGGPPIHNTYTRQVQPPLGPSAVGSPVYTHPSAPPLAPPPASTASQAVQNSASMQEGDTTCPANDGLSVPNNFDAIEGGGFLATPHNPASQNAKVNKHVGTAYPSLPPGYQNASPPGGPRMQYPGGPQQFPQQFPQVNPPQFYSYVISRFHKGFVGLQLPVVTSSTIVRCRSCRTYINPFVSFLDQRRWKCNLCYRVNDVPEEFMYNPVTRVYGEPHKRPEVQNATIEFMAPSEYMLRPPQPPVYLFVFDVSHNAIETGYLDTVCKTLLDNLDLLPGNTRTKIGFITFDSTIHFYSLQEGLSQPQMLIISDIEDVFIPMPENLLVNLNESKELIQDLLRTLPQMFIKSLETQSALGPALQAAFKLMSSTGGRITVFQTQLPSLGAGALKPREEPNQKASTKDVPLTPSTDFYKKLALDCSGQQVAVDLFLLSGQYSDLASLGCISRYSAGSVYYYQAYHHQHNPLMVEKLQKELKRYLTRKIGFEAVMRIRCTKGLSIHTFHGNFFVRSTDLLSLPNVNPDAGYAVQMSVEESLTDMQVVCFQSALLYTSSKGERRIRVHTLCLPVVSQLSDVYLGADVQAITGLLANMAVDRSVSASLSDARDALVNAVIDSLSAYRSSVLTIQQPGLMAPASLRLFPLFILALLKQKAFQSKTNTRLDERIFTTCQVKSQPLVYLMLIMHPNLYRIDNLTDEGALNIGDRTVPQPPILQLSVEKLNRDGAFLMDAGSVMFLWVGKNCGQNFISQVLGAPNYASIPQNMTHLPELNTAESSRVLAFIFWLREQRPFFPILYILKDESPWKPSFLQNMIEDRTESALSYYEFLLHIQQKLNK